MLKNSLLFYASKSCIIVVQVLAFTESLLVLLPDLCLTVGTSSIHQWFRAIPVQIILVKQVNIPVYSIEIRNLSLMPLVNPLHAREFTGRSKAVLL